MTSSRSVQWSLRGDRVLGPAPFFVAGIVNVTPDSFFDGGRLGSVDDAVHHALRLLSQGADMVDVGGESTRPFAQPVEAGEEERRVLPVVRGILARCPECVVSVDTSRSGVAREALRAGAQIVNDVSAGRRDPELVDVVAEAGCGYVLMHSQGTPADMQVAPSYSDVADEVMFFFEKALSALTRRGIAEAKVAVDPGIGFGKTLEHNLCLLRCLGRFRTFGRPVYIGLSQKSWLKSLLGLEPNDRTAATQTATALVYLNGADIHRVHDVKSALHGLRLAQHLRPESGEPEKGRDVFL